MDRDDCYWLTASELARIQARDAFENASDAPSYFSQGFLQYPGEEIIISASAIMTAVDEITWQEWCHKNGQKPYAGR